MFIYTLEDIITMGFLGLLVLAGILWCLCRVWDMLFKKKGED